MSRVVRSGSESYDEISIKLGSGVNDKRVTGVRRIYRMYQANMISPVAIGRQR